MKFKKIVAIVVCVSSCFFIICEKIDAKELESLKTKNSILKIIKNETNFILEDNKLLLPCVGILSSKFGYRESNNPVVSKNHKGIDIAAPKGTSIVAAHDGVVFKSEIIGNYGKCVIIQNLEYITLYAHCSKLLVKEGERIFKGQKIAEVGMTRECNG